MSDQTTHPRIWEAVAGEDERLMRDGRRVLFPHVLIPRPTGGFDKLIINCGGLTMAGLDANAHLIAAAPDLALALEPLLFAVKHGAGADEWSRIKEKAEAALSKSKGGPW